MFRLFKRHIPRVGDTQRRHARAGATLLDKRVPGWQNGIDTRSLNIASYSNCALGQTFGNYVIGLAVLRMSAAESVKYGFADIDAEYEALTEAWKAEVYERKQKVLV